MATTTALTTHTVTGAADIAAAHRAAVGPPNRRSDSIRRSDWGARHRDRRNRTGTVAADNLSLSLAGAPGLPTTGHAAPAQCVHGLRAAPDPRKPNQRPGIQITSCSVLIRLAPQPPSDSRHNPMPARARLPIPLLWTARHLTIGVGSLVQTISTLITPQGTAVAHTHISSREEKGQPEPVPASVEHSDSEHPTVTDGPASWSRRSWAEKGTVGSSPTT